MEPGGVVEQLQAIGMSGYEAKAYVALVAAGEPLNGYEAAKRSGVPRSTVYETLAKLVARGAAFEVHVGDAVSYVALPPESLLARLERDLTSQLDALSRTLPAIAAPPVAHLMHHLPDRSSVMARARDLVAGARDDLFLSLWPAERDELKPLVRDAVRRGVHVSVVTFGDDADPVGHSYPHQFSQPDVVLDRVGAQLLVVAADRAAVLIGGSLGDDMWATWSDDPAVVLVAVEFVRHDIAMQVLVDRIGADEVDALWHTDAELQRLATGRGAPRLDARRAAVRLRPDATVTSIDATGHETGDGRPTPRRRRATKQP